MTRQSSRQTVTDALPGTVAQIMAKTGVSRATVYQWIGVLRAEGACHIKSWRRTTGCATPYFAAGPGTDAKKPRPRTSSEHSHKHYMKHRSALEKELRASARAVRQNVERAAKVPNTWLSALGAS